MVEKFTRSKMIHYTSNVVERPSKNRINECSEIVLFKFSKNMFFTIGSIVMVYIETRVDQFGTESLNKSVGNTIGPRV